MDFNAGELVRLKSGGALMVVDKVADEETVWCSWREEGDRQVRRETFSPVVLKKVAKPISPANGDGRRSGRV
jgi:uncharacterized protein YodC (DUF2158 family)